MIYSSYVDQAAIDDDKPVMTKLNGDTWVGQRNGLSARDIAGVTMLVTKLAGASQDTLRNQEFSPYVCAGVGQASFLSQAKVEAQACTGASHQRWHPYTHPDPRRVGKLLIDAKSGHCLDVPGGSMASGTGLQQFPCHFGSNQAFLFERSSVSAGWRIRNLRSRLCLDLPSTAGQVQIQQRTCNSTARQRWFHAAL